MIRLLIVLISMLFIGCFTMYLDDAFETACIKGQLSDAQAYMLQVFPEKRREPGYCLGQTYTDKKGKVREGTAWCRPVEGDRILSGSCSQALKTLKTGD